MAVQSFGYNLSVGLQSYGADGLICRYYVNVGPLERSVSQGAETVYFRREATLEFTSYTMSDPGSYSQSTINPLVLPASITKPSEGRADYWQRAETSYFGGTGAASLTMGRLDGYDGMRTLKLLHKVYDYTSTEACRKRVDMMDDSVQRRYYNYDDFTRFMFNLHLCGARNVKEFNYNDHRMMIQSAQFTPANVDGFKLETLRIWDRVVAKRDAALVAA